MTEQLLGRSINRLEDERFVKGRGCYIADLSVPDALHGVVVRSPHAHARIVAIHVDAALRIQGVAAVLTGFDLAADNIGPLPCAVTNIPMAKPLIIPPCHALAREAVRYVGEPIAFVVAESAETARDAAEAIVVDYEPLQPVISMVEAVRSGNSSIWPEAQNNVAFEFQRGEIGPVEAAMHGAAHVVECELINNRVVAAPLETRGALGAFDASNGRLHLTASAAGAHMIRDLLADSVFRIPREKLRVSIPDVGGGFGMKNVLYPEWVLVLWAARRVGRPVKWIGNRSEDFIASVHGRDSLVRARLALDRDGKFLALEAKILANMGAYISTVAPVVPTMAMGSAMGGVYDIPLVAFQTSGVFTNTMPVGAYRGAGRPEGVFIVERLMDAAARQIGMDPRAIRKVNYIKPAQLPYTNAVGQVYDSGAFAHMLERASKLSDWDGFAARKKAARKKGLLYGRGLTSYIEWTGGRAHTEKVSLHATAEGRVILHSGTQAMGQGLQTTYSQMIAESLGISIDKIDVVQGDTDLATGFGSVGSRSLFVGGTAVAVSSSDLIAKAREKASNMLEASVEDIEYHNGWLTVVGTDKRIGLFDIAKDEKGARLSVDSEGEVDGPSWPNGTHICEVEIDPETGVSRVVRYTTVDDVGVAVNPMLVTGQVHGGVAQGIGQALYEGVAYDPEGQLLTASYQDYCLPRADDIPPIEVTLDDSAPCRTNPLGAKGCGESGAIGGPPCITNGVMDALSELGIKTLNTPLSPLKVWQAIREAKAAGV